MQRAAAFATGGQSAALTAVINRYLILGTFSD